MVKFALFCFCSFAFFFSFCLQHFFFLFWLWFWVRLPIWHNIIFIIALSRISSTGDAVLLEYVYSVLFRPLSSSSDLELLPSLLVLKGKIELAEKVSSEKITSMTSAWWPWIWLTSSPWSWAYYIPSTVFSAFSSFIHHCTLSREIAFIKLAGFGSVFIYDYSDRRIFSGLIPVLLVLLFQSCTVPIGLPVFRRPLHSKGCLYPAS